MNGRTRPSEGRRRRLGRVALGCLASVALLATGAGLALAVVGAMGSPGTDGAPASTSRPESGGSLDVAIPPRSLAKGIDPAVVDVEAVIETPSGPADDAGTGMIVTPGGEVVTNNHVVEGAMRITVRLGDHGRRYRAAFVAADPSEDVAVLQIHGPPPGLAIVHFTPQSRPVLGEGVLAIGNSLGLDGTPSVTSGQISGLKRSIVATSETGSDAEHLKDMLEASAQIDPGNSGGPLVNAAGDVIGMTTATESTVGPEGSPLTFAIPAGVVSRVIDEIAAGVVSQKIVRGREAYLGLTASARPLVAEGVAGVDVLEVEPNSPAWSSGLEADDVVVSIDGIPIPSMRVLSQVIRSREPGDRVTIVFRVATGATVLQRRHTVSVRLVPGPVA